MTTRFLYFIVIIGLLMSCNNSPTSADKVKLALESEENNIINIVFEATVGPDTLWTKHLKIPPAFIPPAGHKTKEDKLEHEHYMKVIDEWKARLDTANLYVFFNDSIVKYRDDRNKMESMLNSNDFKPNFPGIDTIYRPLLLKLIDSTFSRKLDISLIKTNFKYKLDYKRNEGKYPSDIVKIADVTISRVAFNLNRTKACVYSAFICGRLCGGGTIYFLGKINGVWSIIGKRELWVS